MKDSYSFYTNKLNDEYKSAFEQVETYVFVLNIDNSTVEQRMGELLDIFLSAKEEGLPVSKMIGNNIEKFCKTFCCDFGFKNRMLNIFDGIKRIAWLLLIFSLLDISFLISDMQICILTTVLTISLTLFLLLPLCYCWLCNSDFYV